MGEVMMPRLSDTMQEGTIAEWLKKEGDTIEKGDVLAEIETDKATMPLESYEAGILEKIVVKAGQTVPIGQVVANIGKGGNGAATASATQSAPAPVSAQAPAAAVSPTATAATVQVAPAPSAPPSSSPAPAASTPVQREGGRVKASPMAKRLAAEYGVNLETIQGSGPGGRIVSDDVKAATNGKAQPATVVETAVSPTAAPAWGGSSVPSETSAPAQPQAAPTPAQPQAQAEAAPPPPASPATSTADYEEKELSRMRLIIARRLTEAKQQIPHIYISNEINMGEAMKLRQTINANIEKEGGVKVSVNDLVIKGVAKALKKFPVLNASFLDTKIRYNKRIHVSFAVALEDGLITPVIFDADQKTIGQIALEAKALIGRARAGKLRLEEFQGGTFSVSNLGMFDTTEFMAVINPPNTGILAVGAVKPTPVVSGHEDSDSYDEVTIAQVMKVTISVDHRAADGAVAAQFLQELKRLLQTPMSLLI